MPQQHLSCPGPADYRSLTLGGTPLDERSARFRCLYLTKHSTATVQVAITELLNYIHSVSTASVQVTMTELLTQFQWRICSSNNDRITYTVSVPHRFK